MFWLGIVYFGSIVGLIVQSFYSLDPFSGLVIPQFSLDSYSQLFSRANLDIMLRTILMASIVTITCTLIAFPISYQMAMKASPRIKTFLHLSVLLPLWSSYIVRVYSWKLILAKEGVLTWLTDKLYLNWLLEAILSLPVIGGTSLSYSYIGIYIVFVYIWLPYMILPVEAALQRIPNSLLESSQDLGAAPLETFRRVTLPLALPGIIAGSIFTFSLTLGDYIIPNVIGNSSLFIGQAVLAHQGTAGNLPLAAAMTVVPMIVMVIYLISAKRMGAFDAL